MKETRRQLIKSLAGICLTVNRLAEAMRFTAGEKISAVQSVTLDLLSLLMVDDSGLSGSKNVVREFHQAKTMPQAVIVADRPWEGERVYIYGSVYPASEGFRMWYMGMQSDREDHQKLPEKDHVLYATSKDGLLWDKPTLGVHEFQGSTANNIVYGCHSPSVLYDRFEKDPSRRYKLLGVRHGNYCSAESSDGLHWRPVSDKAILGADTITLSQSPATGEYLAFHKQMTQIREYKRRTIWLAKSRDFRTWSEPVMVLAPDELDDVWATKPHQRTEIYDMSVYPHASGFLGLPVIFHVEAQRTNAETLPDQSPLDGPLDVQFATSRDGVLWDRAADRLNVIPRGPKGNFDAGAILGVSSTPIHTNDESWVYYTGITTGHGGGLPEKRLAIGRAAWRRDGYASLRSLGQAEIVTVPLSIRGQSIALNAAIDGTLLAELRDEKGQPLFGLTFKDCVPVRGDATSLFLRWKGNSRLPDRPVRIALRWDKGSVFALRAV